MRCSSDGNEETSASVFEKRIRLRTRAITVPLDEFDSSVESGSENDETEWTEWSESSSRENYETDWSASGPSDWCGAEWVDDSESDESELS